MDPYTILGIPRNASQEEIKKAYKALALKYHPDKNLSHDNINFTEINNAYQILKDPTKRKIYDDSCAKDLNDIVFQMFDVFCDVMSERFTKIRGKKIINLNITVKLQEIYNKSIKKINVKVKKLRGEEETVTLYLSLLNYQNEYIYKSMGDEYEERGKVLRGDISVSLNILDDDLVKLDRIVNKYDLFLDMSLSLYEYYFGLERKLNYFGEEIKVKKDKFDSESLVFIAKGKGLPYCEEDEDDDIKKYNKSDDNECKIKEEKRGDLYVYFKLILPRNHNELSEFLRKCQETMSLIY